MFEFKETCEIWLYANDWLIDGFNGMSTHLELADRKKRKMYSLQLKLTFEIFKSNTLGN